MNPLRVHALEAHNVVTKVGLAKLLRILNPDEQTVLVLSSLGNEELDVRDLLLLAKNRDERLWSLVEARMSSWENVAESVLDQSNSVVATIKEGFDNIEDILRSVWLVGEISADLSLYLSKLASSWVALIVHSFLQHSDIESEYLEYSNVIERPHTSVTVVYCEEGEKRSEYAAALLGAKLEAVGVTFWNSTSLLTSADSKDVPSALVIRSLTYAEATELSYYGSPIIYPQALLPAIEAEIEVMLRYWDAEDDPGTIISKEGNGTPYLVKGFSTIRNVALVNVEGAGMSGVVGISARLFEAIRNANISIILISQGSSESSICFAVYQEQMAEAIRVARLEFEEELAQKKIHTIAGHDGLAILAAVGEKMSGQRGIS
ncbi:MAG: ACT domain-containing protein, partial [Sphaerochaeta sp.]